MESSESQQIFSDSSFVEFDVERIRETDRRAIEEFDVPGLYLMERASLGILAFAQVRFSQIIGRGVRILVGRGNNGGDGLALARHFHGRGYEVEARCTFEAAETRNTADSRTNAQLTSTLLGPRVRFGAEAVAELIDDPEPFDGLWIDALLGTGFRGELRPNLRAVVRALNTRKEVVLAVDTPSGLDASQGRPSPTAVIATATATLGASKPGFREPEARRYLGELTTLEIGWPQSLLVDHVAPRQGPQASGHPVTTSSRLTKPKKHRP